MNLAFSFSDIAVRDVGVTYDDLSCIKNLDEWVSLAEDYPRGYPNNLMLSIPPVDSYIIGMHSNFDEITLSSEDRLFDSYFKDFYNNNNSIFTQVYKFKGISFDTFLVKYDEEELEGTDLDGEDGLLGVQFYDYSYLGEHLLTGEIETIPAKSIFVLPEDIVQSYLKIFSQYDNLKSRMFLSGVNAGISLMKSLQSDKPSLDRDLESTFIKYITDNILSIDCYANILYFKNSSNLPDSIIGSCKLDSSYNASLNTLTLTFTDHDFDISCENHESLVPYIKEALNIVPCDDIKLRYWYVESIDSYLYDIEYYFRKQFEDLYSFRVNLGNTAHNLILDLFQDRGTFEYKHKGVSRFSFELPCFNKSDSYILKSSSSDDIFIGNNIATLVELEVSNSRIVSKNYKFVVVDNNNLKGVSSNFDSFSAIDSYHLAKSRLSGLSPLGILNLIKDKVIGTPLYYNLTIPFSGYDTSGWIRFLLHYDNSLVVPEFISESTDLNDIVKDNIKIEYFSDSVSLAKYKQNLKLLDGGFTV